MSGRDILTLLLEDCRNKFVWYSRLMFQILVFIPYYCPWLTLCMGRIGELYTTIVLMHVPYGVKEAFSFYVINIWPLKFGI